MNKNKFLVIWLDPRTKLILMFLCIIAIMSSATLHYELGLVILIALLGGALGKWKYSIKASVFYLIIYIATLWIMDSSLGLMRATLLAFLSLFHKVYPCGMLGGLLLSSTKVSEFLSAMNQMNVPKVFVIPLAVMIRYLPTIREDWHFIQDAMIMRGISPTFSGLLSRPILTINCLYVPLLMAASKTADELSVAAITRGIENPKKRTCFVNVRFRKLDGVVLLSGLCYVTIGIYLKIGGS